MTLVSKSARAHWRRIAATLEREADELERLAATKRASARFWRNAAEGRLEKADA